MSTIGSLMLALGQSTPAPFGDIQAQTAATRGRELGNETALLTLAELKRSQASEEEIMAAIQRDPALARLLFGDATLGGLGTPSAPGGVPSPGGGAITQRPLAGGQPQTIPAYPDASRYAGVSPQGGGPIPPSVAQQVMPQVTPPQSTLAALGPAGQPQMQAPRNPALEMAQRNPRAAMMLQQQMQAQQDRQWKMQEQQLSMGVKVMEYIARGAQAVKSQEDLESLRQDVARVHPQAAASLPQMYSPGAMEPFIARGTAAADRAQNAYHEAKARNLDMETRMFPELAKRFGLEGEAQTPAGEAPTSTAPPTGQQARTAPPEYESAITEANRLYPQVKPERIKSIIAAESNFDNKAVSPAGAKGPMQLMDGTAKDMDVDDPFDINQNVRGGTRYYAQMLTRYGGDERKALAAYNWGPGNLDKVNGDVSKAPAETQAYVNRVLGGGGGGATGTAQTAPTDPRIAQLETKIAQRTRDAQIASLMKNESLSTRLEDEAKRLRDERTRLLNEARHQQERAEAIPRKVEEQAALEPGELRKQRAAAEVSLEAKMNEPIGPENALNMNLPPNTRWKDVPKDVKITKQLGDTTAKQFSEFKASHAGLGRVLTMLDNPKAQSIVGTLFSGDNAAFRRRAGEWISSVTPQERKFVASLVAEIADIRHTLSGSAVSATESEFLQPMMPSAADPDVATVRAKLEALQEWMTRKHDAYRDQFEQSGYRVPAALARTEEKAPQGSGAVEKAKNAMKPR